MDAPFGYSLDQLYYAYGRRRYILGTLAVPLSGLSNKKAERRLTFELTE
jgi:hypothetical protein